MLRYLDFALYWLTAIVLIAFTILALSGCASQQLHAVGEPSMPQTQANLTCMPLWYDYPLASTIPIAGALWYASADWDARRHPLYRQCLRDHGWALPDDSN